MKKETAAIILLIILAITVTSVVIYKVKLDEKPQTYVNLNLVNVGFEYYVYGECVGGSHQHLVEGTLSIVNGSTVYISMGEDKTGIYLRATAFEVNGQTIDEEQEVKLVASSDLTVKAIVADSPLKQNINLLASRNITVIEGYRPSRGSGFSHTLTYLKIDQLADFASLCNSKDVGVVIHFRGLLQTGWIWDPSYDYFYFMENENVYYVQTNI